MKILHLTLKKKWFDLIASGEKKEEYRERKPYWKNRLHGESKSGTGRNEDSFRHFDVVEFKNGYGKDAPKITVQFMGIDIRVGRKEWGAEPDKEYFVIKLGNILTPNL